MNRLFQPLSSGFVQGMKKYAKDEILKLDEKVWNSMKSPN